MRFMRIRKPVALVASIVISELAGAIGSVFSISAIPNWYAALNKPSFNPPNWLFGPVWTILYFLMGVSAYLIYANGIKKNNARMALYAFSVQLVLNVLWSFAFFGLRSTSLGFAAIILLWISIAVTTVMFYRIRKSAGWLMLPYILWVSFAAVLNYFILILN
jgi:tryptophan-rich sensory protein